eukprot:2188707-Pyramimonas_sp.AAC.1
MGQDRHADRVLRFLGEIDQVGGLTSAGGGVWLVLIEGLTSAPAGGGVWLVVIEGLTSAPAGGGVWLVLIKISEHLANLICA